MAFRNAPAVQRDTPLPYYRWYVMEYRGSLRAQKLNWQARGIYRELLDECWRVGYIPDDPLRLAEICRTPLGIVARAWEQLRPMFIPVEGLDGHLLTNERLELERTKEDRGRIQRSHAGKASAEKRNARQRPLNARDIVVVEQRRVEQSSTAAAPDGAQPLSELLGGRCPTCTSRGAAFAAGVHAPGCSSTRESAG
jgi:uncharacterized protein YdaU (DUF1376 family)